MSNSTSGAVQKPGPWFVEPVTDGPNCRRWSVARWNPAADPGYDYESMEDGRGGEAIFFSPSEARDAIAAADCAVRTCHVCNLPPIRDCKFANCGRHFASITEAQGASA